eukprot:2483106-Rhodomonas_salina.2
MIGVVKTSSYHGPDIILLCSRHHPIMLQTPSYHAPDIILSCILSCSRHHPIMLQASSFHVHTSSYHGPDIIISWSLLSFVGTLKKGPISILSQGAVQVWDPVKGILCRSLEGHAHWVNH